MDLKIKFDKQNNPLPPTFVLATRNGKKLGIIPASEIVFKNSLSLAEISFKVYKKKNDISFLIWDKLKDFRLLWCKEWNAWFEIYVEIEESNSFVKNVSAKSLGEAELSQINIYDTEINTEDDIERDDYEPTVLYNEQNPSASLLNRVLEKAPHYVINHVDSSIASIQRTFSFDNKSIYNVFQEVAEEIDCLFVLTCKSDSSGNIVREINVYDLESYCVECGHRGEFTSSCEDCGSSNILTGYGDDTGIFVSTDNLADNITFTTDNGSVKNCFKLKAGDDLMTATVINCNPNGSGYIWYISEETKADMSDELSEKLSEYDELYDYYQNEYEYTLNGTILSKYNNLIEKYETYTSDYQEMPSTLVGYPAIMEAYYNVVDFYYYLNNELMPSIEIATTNAALEAAKITRTSLSPVAVKDLNVCSVSTASSAVLAMAKTIVDGRYQVKISDGATFENNEWTGSFIVTNYSDEEDTATTSNIAITINDDYESYVRQKITKTLNKQEINQEITNIVDLFKLNAEAFVLELKKYSLARLTSFYDACQSCLDILIQQGIADDGIWADREPNLYETLYQDYYNKLGLISEEIALRESEIAIIIGQYDSEEELFSKGIQTYIESERDSIQSALNFEEYLGNSLMLEFAAYRREDTYQNDNYISDGLNNAELFQYALNFIKTAKKDIFKSATLQHSISATMKNLLVMKEFAPLVEGFKLGNWIRIRSDGKIYRLRLLDYEISYENLGDIPITFSDVTQTRDGVSDVESILNQASDISTSYNAVAHQAQKGNEGNNQLKAWAENGLSLTKMKIVDNADNQNISWDSHGLLGKEYLPITDSYDDKQIKLINRGLYLTDDNWSTVKTGIGDFTYWNPETQQMEEDYGVIAKTIVGHLVLSEKVGVYNKDNSISLDEKGIVVTTNAVESDSNKVVFTIQRKTEDGGTEIIEPIMYIDGNGQLVLNGSVKINTPATGANVDTLGDLCNDERITNRVNELLYERIYGENGLNTTINQKYNEVAQQTKDYIDNYKSTVGQYMSFDNGLTLGAQGSPFKTVVDNIGLWLKQNDVSVAYINNNQLYVPDAVIKNTLTLGKFFFSPREDGGFSITWQGNQQ